MAYQPFNNVLLKDGSILKLATVGSQYINGNNNLGISSFTLGDNIALYEPGSKTYELKSGWKIVNTASRASDGTIGNDISVYNPSGTLISPRISARNVKKTPSSGEISYSTDFYLTGGILADGNSYIGYLNHNKISEYYNYQYNSYLRSVSFGYNNFNGIWTDSGIFTDDPYVDGGSSTSGGGGGDFDNTSQPVDFPDLPSLSAVDSGFVSVYNPSNAELKELATFMWSTDFFDNIIKLWADPMEVILNLAMLPVAIPTSGAREIVVGNVSTGVTVSVASSQFMYVDCGSINVNEYWGAYLDYSPYTKISIYLPYVGTHQLNIDDVMSKTVHVKYIVDILSGACVAFVKSGESVLYSYSGNCATNIPVTSANYARSMQAILGAVGGTIGSAISGNGVGVATGIGGMAGAVMSAKPSVERSGNLSGNAGLLGHQYPYLILERPRQCAPLSQNTYSGYPSYITVSLSSVSGYTVVDSINLKNVNITEVEKSELIDILKKGVYF